MLVSVKQVYFWWIELNLRWLSSLCFFCDITLLPKIFLYLLNLSFYLGNLPLISLKSYHFIFEIHHIIFEIYYFKIKMPHSIYIYIKKEITLKFQEGVEIHFITVDATQRDSEYCLLATAAICKTYRGLFIEC
jgi:hypothetical protein